MHNCSRCKKVFYQKGDLNRHLRRKNPCKIETPSIINKKKEEKQIICEYCKRGFYSKHTLSRHIENENTKCYHMKIVKEMKNMKVIDGTDLINKVQSKTIRKVDGNVKRVVACNQDWKCNICNDKLPSNYDTDHITPLHRGGSNEIANLQALCKTCHGEKSIMEQISN